MPTRELRPYIARRAHVEARRQVAAAQHVAIGVGRLKPDDHRAVVSGWARDMSAVGRKDPEALASAVKASRIGFRTVSVKKKGKASR